MQQLQCIACNLTIPDSYSADGCCSCGHVFTEKKLIGGKRFSEYRAELYSRLETKRQKILLKGNTSVNNEVQGKCSFERPGRLNVQLPRIPNTESIVKRSPGQRSKEAATGRSKPVIRRSPNPLPQAVKPQLAQSKVLQSLLRRFPSALAEINKRLISQNLLWFTINDRTNTQRLEIPKPNVWRQFSETV
ncbi:hypothetical protein ABFA07_000204 [Porites harrisoni]